MSNPASEQARRATRALGLAEAFAPGPDPEASLRRAETVLEAAAAADPTGLEAALSDHPTVLRRVLHALCAVAPFMTAQLRARPERLLALARDLLGVRALA